MNLTTTTDAAVIESVLKAFRTEMPRLIGKVGSLSDYAEKLAQHAQFLILHDGIKCIGFIAFYSNDLNTRTGFITLVVVDSAYRGKHCGSELMNAAMIKMRSAGMLRVRLAVARTNSIAKAFYRHMGFFFDSTPDADCEYMEKTL